MKTHAVNGTVWQVDMVKQIYGVTSYDPEAGKSEVVVLDEPTFRAFAGVYHETLHMLGIPDEYVHGQDGCCATDDGARLIWRWLKAVGLLPRRPG